MPEPMPRPTRFFFSVDFLGARIVDKFISSSWVPGRRYLRPYFTISTRCGTFFTMPRIAAVSGRSITWFSRVKPSPLITFLCFTGVQMIDRTHFNCSFPLTTDFDVLVVISLPRLHACNRQFVIALVPKLQITNCFYNSSTDLPRRAATASRLLSFLSASKVALITLCGLLVPIDLVNTFC